jgi:hypothetical protein
MLMRIDQKSLEEKFLKQNSEEKLHKIFGTKLCKKSQQAFRKHST